MTEFPEVLELRRKAHAMDARVGHFMNIYTELARQAYRMRRKADETGSADDLELAEQLEAQTADAQKAMITANDELWALLEPRPAMPGRALFQRVMQFLAGSEKGE